MTDGSESDSATDYTTAPHMDAYLSSTVNDFCVLCTVEDNVIIINDSYHLYRRSVVEHTPGVRRLLANYPSFRRRLYMHRLHFISDDFNCQIVMWPSAYRELSVPAEQCCFRWRWSPACNKPVYRHLRHGFLLKAKRKQHDVSVISNNGD